MIAHKSERYNGDCETFIFFRRINLLNNFDFDKLFAAISRKSTYRKETEFVNQWNKKTKMEKQ